MKTSQIKGVKYKVFEEKELREKLNMKEEDIQLVLEYQKTFPEMLKNNGEYINSARQLYIELGIDKSNWSRWIKKNIKENTFFIENKDWWGFVIMTNGNKVEDFKITVEFAKHLCMTAKTEKGYLFRSYFILMEKTLRNYEEWNKVREPEKQNANVLKSALKIWANKNFKDYDDKGIYAREFNMLNVNLTGKNASGIRRFVDAQDIQTREHLDTEVNKALDELQLFDINLLTCNMSFGERCNMIKQVCETKYINIKEEFTKEINN